MIKRRAPVVLYSVLVLTYLGFLLYFLTLRPGGSAGNQAVIWAICGFASGGMIMMAIYALTLYLFRRGEKASLYFALFCFAGGIRFLVAEGNMILPEIFPGLSDVAAINIYGVAIGITVIGFVCLNFELFATPKYKKRLPYFIAAIAMIHSADAIITALIGDLFFMRVALLLVTEINLIHIIFMIVKSPGFRTNRIYKLHFVSVLLFIGVSIFTALSPGTFPNLGVISHSVLIIIHIVLLSDRYARAIRDVEETNENLERIVDERTKDIWNVNNAMKELVGNISHDLKTPLTVLNIKLQNLSKRIQASGDAENQRHVEVAYKKCLDLQRLIQNMFEASRIEAGQSLYERKWVSLRWLMIQAREKYSVFLEGEGLFLDIKYNKDTQIIIDPQKIWSVFDNIIYNAVRYTEKGGVISITAKAGDSAVDVTVTDTGCGIAPEHLPRIFERFYKVSPGRGGDRGDSGLGLYIVKSVMEGIGGSVRAESEPGKGTSIILTFPRGM